MCARVPLQASAWRELEGSKLSPWVTPPDPLRKAQRLREMEAARLRCRSALSPKIREQVCVYVGGAVQGVQEGQDCSGGVLGAQLACLIWFSGRGWLCGWEQGMQVRDTTGQGMGAWTAGAATAPDNLLNHYVWSASEHPAWLPGCAVE